MINLTKWREMRTYLFDILPENANEAELALLSWCLIRDGSLFSHHQEVGNLFKTNKRFGKKHFELQKKNRQLLFFLFPLKQKKSKTSSKYLGISNPVRVKISKNGISWTYCIPSLYLNSHFEALLFQDLFLVAFFFLEFIEICILIGCRPWQFISSLLCVL